MFRRIEFRKELILYIAIFVLIYLLYNNSFFLVNPTNLIKPLLQFQLGGLLYDFFRYIFIILPYFIYAAILVFVIKHFANLIKDKSIRRILKVLSLFILLFGVLIIGFDIAQPQIRKNTSNPVTTTTKTTTGTNTTSTNTTTSSSGITASKTSITYPSFTPTLPSSISLQIPNYFYQVLNILSLLIILFVLFIFIRSFQPYLFRNIKRDNQDSKQVKLKKIDGLDFNRQMIFQEYLKLSSELEMKGINPDFSLTPLEFGNEAINNLEINEFRKITYYYELARFSNSPISIEEYREFESLVKEIYINLINKLDEGKNT